MKDFLNKDIYLQRLENVKLWFELKEIDWPFIWYCNYKEVDDSPELQTRFTNMWYGVVYDYSLLDKFEAMIDDVSNG